jgi:hypothetical protein
MAKMAGLAQEMVPGFHVPLQYHKAKFSGKAMLALLAVSRRIMDGVMDIPKLGTTMFSSTVMADSMKDLNPPVDNVAHTVTFTVAIETVGGDKLNRAANPDLDAIYGADGVGLLIEDLRAESSSSLNGIQIRDIAVVDDFTTKFTVDVLKA